MKDFAGVPNINQKTGNFSILTQVLSRTDIHAPINLTGISADDRSVQFPGQPYRQAGFPRSGGPQHRQQTGIVPHLFYLLHHSLSETADQFQTSVIVYPVITQLMKTLRAGTLQSRRKTSRIIADAINRMHPETLWRKRSYR